MDSAIRDLERIREYREASRPTSRQVGLVALAGLATSGIVLSLFAQVGSSADADTDADPLARLGRSSDLAAASSAGGAEPPEEPEVDPVALTFPETLVGNDRIPEDPPEVALALAAASAELRHLDPIEAGSDRAAPGAPVGTEAIAERLPAAIAAGSRDTLERAAPHDPLLLEALPERRAAIRAPEGHDGEYTLQVISYDSPESAHAFAAGLRARGHSAFVMRAEVEGRGPVYRVRIGPFASLAEANAYRRRFEETERMNTIVVRKR
jgi:cell division septation protein DedD